MHVGVTFNPETDLLGINGLHVFLAYTPHPRWKGPYSEYMVNSIPS